MTWPDFYRGRLLSEGYLAYFEERYAPFLDHIRKALQPEDLVIEVGCGLATSTKLLMRSNVPYFTSFRCYDHNPDMVQLAKQNVGVAAMVAQADARIPTYTRPDVVHSHGLLEHFSDTQIAWFLASQRLDGPRVSIHYVPGELHGTPSFGDERLLPLDYWVDTFAPTSWETFNDGRDYVLVWEGQR